MATNNVFTNTNKRLFYLSDDINKSTIGELCFNLLYLLQEDDEKDSKEKDFKREPIKIYINSDGGEVYDMWALIDIMLNAKTPIYTYCTGYAMSAAFQIFLAGGKRFASKHSTFLYHQVYCWRNGKYQDLVEDRVEMDHIQNEIETYVKDRTKITEEKLIEIKEKKIDWYIHCDEALKLGIVTDIIEESKDGD